MKRSLNERRSMGAEKNRIGLILATAAIFWSASIIGSKAAADVRVPTYNDKYSKLMKQVEAGQTNIDYTEFRQSFLQSEQFKVAGKQSSDLENLRKKMHQLMKGSNYADLIDVGKKMLSIDYTDMEAQKIVRQAYKFLGDAANST